MQSVPSEFVAHLRPLMFVAGLGPPSDPTAVEPPGAPSADPHSSSAASQQAASAPNPREESFKSLIKDLRNVLMARRTFVLYDPLAASARQNNLNAKVDFHVALVDKKVRFPPRKARLPNNQTGPHSPISPFSSTSPLYPDGIMAPIWVRKHRELVPSVFVLILRLYEFGHPYSMTAEDPGNSHPIDEPDVGPLEKEKVERVRDSEIITEILARKRMCSERGIKLAVVLLTSRDMLDDPSLDPRLSHIRRSSTLDSRASLFVLSPVPAAEVNNFVMSLKAELLDSSIDYYREHGRRLRRKRSRPANATPALSTPSTFSPVASPNPASAADDALARTQGAAAFSPQAQPLSNQALNVRYEYKAAVFAELRGELEVALKHYEDCYTSLLDLFVTPSTPLVLSASSQIDKSPSPQSSITIPQLPPRTKRWAEARVLADCLSVKICKLYLYAGNSPYAMGQYRQHLYRFTQIGKSVWDMDEKGFEYWSWATKQHRLFAELLEAAIKSGFKLPPLPGGPVAAPPLHARAAAQHVPDSVLQHPGFYYYMAGLSAVRRRDCFLEAAKACQSADQEPSALRHERNFNHSSQIIELFTHAYEYFKRHKGTRVSLYLADQIASVHLLDNNRDTVLKFDDRISKTYRREHWEEVLDRVVARSLKAAQESPQEMKGSAAVVNDGNAKPDKNGDQGVVDATGRPRDSSIARLEPQVMLKNMFERMALHPDDEPGHRQLISNVSGALSKLGDGKPPGNIIFISTETRLPITASVAFWKDAANLNVSVPFQLHIVCPPAMFGGSADLKLTGLSLRFSDKREPITVQCVSAGQGNAQDRICIGKYEDSTDRRPFEVNLEASNGDLVINGSLTSSEPQKLTITEVVCTFTLQDHDVVLQVVPRSLTIGRSVWLLPHGEPGQPQRRVPLPGRDHSSCNFEPRKIRATFDHRCPSVAYLNEVLPIIIEVTNHESFPITVSLDALLHPLATQTAETNDTLCLEDQPSSTSDGQRATTSTSSAELAKSLAPGQTATKKIILTSFGTPGPRHIELSAICKPAATTADIEQVATTELSKQLSVDVVHPFFCDFQPAFYQSTPSPKKTDVSFDVVSEPPELSHSWQDAKRCLLNVSLGALGPMQLELLGVKLDLEDVAKEVRIIKASLEPDDGQLPEIFEPEDPYAMSFELELSQHYFRHVGRLPHAGVLELTWRRVLEEDSKSPATPCNTTKTFIPVPLIHWPLSDASKTQEQEVFVTAKHPSRAILHQPFTVQYSLTLPSAHSAVQVFDRFSPRTVSYLIEPTSENFVFSGLRKVDRQLVLPSPDGEDTPLVEFTAVPIGSTGQMELPRLKVWEILDTPYEEHEQRRQVRQQYGPAEEQNWQPRMRQLAVVRKGSLLDATKEGEQSSDELVPPLTVFVVPR